MTRLHEDNTAGAALGETATERLRSYTTDVGGVDAIVT
jgi:hypothetical protein